NGLIQFPRPMLMPVCSVEQRSGGADFDTVATLRTVQPVAVRADDGARAAIAGFDRLLAHPFVADPGASLAENAALRIVRDHRRQIFFWVIILLLSETLFQIAPVESLLLQLALAATIAHRTIQRMIRQQKLEHRALRFLNLFALRGDDHAVSAGDGAGSLQ